MGEQALTLREVLRQGKRMLPPRLRQEFNRLRRLQTATERLLPDFIIAGTQKGGTSSLYAYLARHPQVVAATTKEVHYFDNHFHKGDRWYRSHFPTAEEMRLREHALHKRTVTGEASPYYMFHPHAPRRISEVVPNVKLLILLRNPARRAYSHYHHMLRAKIENLPFREAIDREEARLEGELEKMQDDEKYYSFNYQHFSYVARGIYADQIEAYYKYFERDQILVLKSEDLFEQTQTAYDTVLDFLELDSYSLPRAKPRNVGNYADNGSGLDPRLHEHFRPHNERLCDLIGAQYHW